MRWEAVAGCCCRWLAVLLLLLSFDLTNLATAFLETKEVDDSPLFVVNPPDTIATATGENKIGICNYNDNKVTCKQYDAEGKSKIFEAEATLGDYRIKPRDFYMFNLDKGLFTVMIAYAKRGETIEREIFVVHFNEQEKQGEVINVGMKNGDGSYFLNLYKNKIGEPCIMGLFVYYHETSLSNDRFTFSRSTRCFTKKELN